MSQRLRAEHILNKLPLLDDADLKELRDILAEAQNPAPYGAADGSIGPEAYNALSAVADAVRTIHKNGAVFRRALA